MITLFSVPRKFDDDTRTRQRNAILSWTCLYPTPVIVLLGGEDGVAEMAAEVGAEQHSLIERNEFGTPLVNDVFSLAEALARTDLIAYCNADVILGQGFLDAARAVASMVRGPFLIIGQRFDLDLQEELRFDNMWEYDLYERVVEFGDLHAPTGIDYFIWRRGAFGTIPPFALGRYRWDNWLVWNAAQNVPVIDATEVVMAIHQNHNHQHLSMRSEELQRNDRLVQQTGGQLHTISHAAYRLTETFRLVRK